ncbi:unnamed protein product [Lota lota]
MDATQMICDSMLESDEEEENGNARAEPLATLRVFKNKHIPETVLPLYLGENVLGRDPSNCTLPLHAQSVSKQHTAISISVFHASSRRDCASIEALVWDMGSMNGTRKGRLKLTPHVRYALSEEENLMVADIPCQYTSCVDPGSLVNRGSLVARESQGTREDVEVHTNGNAEEPTRASLGECGEMMETPARIKGLSFEQTPTQPEGSLVPASDSDSDGERGRKDQWRKTLVSESDSHVTSPTCSTFLSPTSKIIPESEDESPITPSSSSKHRPTQCVSADNDEQDFGAWQQRLKNKKAAHVIATDGKEEEEKVAPVGADPEKRGGCAPDSLVNSVSTWAKDGLDQPGPALPTELIQVLNMDSDTDVEGEEESSVSVGLGTPNRTQPAPPPPTANAPTCELGQFVMDSDTDVDDEDECVDATPAPTAGEANTTESPGEVLVAQQTYGDTDVEGEDDDEPDRVSKATHASPQSENLPVSWAGSTQPSDFHLESDTDVEEEEDEEGDDAIAKSSSAKMEAESRGVVFASAAPQNFDLDSDTDDDVLPTDANSDPTSEAAQTTPSSAADTGAHLDILSDSDTDVEEDSPLILPAVAVAINAGPMSSGLPSSSGPISLSTALGPDSDADTDVDEISSSPVGVDVSTDPADIRMYSDTDMEDEEEEARAVGTEGCQVSCSSDEKDFGSLQGHRASSHHCSTPVELSGGAVAEMETQEYLSPSIDPFKCPRVPAARLMVSLSSSDSQGEDDFVVAETQSFIVDDREQQSSPSGNYTLDETQPFIPQGTSKHEDGLSESIHLQPKAQALAMESTQPFVLSDGDVNLEATQVYPTTTSLDRSSLELDSDLEATQSYLGSAGSSSHSAGSGIKRPVDIALEATQAFIPESHSDVDAEEEDEVDTTDIASTETQLMDFPSGYTLAMAETQLMCELQEDGREQVDGEETPPIAAGTNCALSSAETQPMVTSEDEESDDEDSVSAPRKRRARRLVEEEDTQVMTGSDPSAAETQPSSSTSSDESKEDEDERLGLKRMLSRNQRKLHGATRTRATAAGTEPEADSDPAQQAKGRPRRGRGRKPGPGTSRGLRDEKEQEPSASLRSTRSKGKTSSSTRGGTGVVRPEEERGEEEEEETVGDQVRQGEKMKTRQPRENVREKKERLERERKEQAENERMLKEQEEQEKTERALREQEGKQRMEREQREKEERERLEREREETERLEVEEKERVERERKEHEEKERLEQIQREKEEQERLQRENKEREERERLEMEEKERVEREQKAREEKEEQERLEREKKDREERLEKEEQERIENHRKEREEKVRLEQIQKEEEERLEQERKEQEERAREERERLEKERRELEETARLEREKKESQEKQRLEREEKERLKKEKSEQERERLRREKDERQQKAALEREEREKSRRAQEEEEDQARLETEKREREEMKRQSDERERLMKEALEKQLLERQQTEAQAQSDEQKPRTTRGRRATITTTALSEPDPENDDGPATRTRSRSHSSNSVSSERSASSAMVQESRRGRGRGRGSKKNHSPAEGAGRPTRESKRRRTVAGDTPAESWAAGPGNGPGRATRSRSNSTDSLNSEVSACSSAQSRGRGARGAGRGRGRKSLPAPKTNSQPSSSGQNEVAKASARGRKTKRLDASAVDGSRGDDEDKPDSQQAATTRGHRRTNTAHSGPIGAEEQEDNPEDSTLVTRSTTGRGRGRKAQLKCEPVVAPVAADRTDVVRKNGSGRAKETWELESEQQEEKPAPVRRGRGSSVQVRRNPNEPPEEVVEEEEEEEETIERKVRRGRQSVAKKKKEEVAGEGVTPATHVMERDAGTSETPTGKSSRKRGAAPVKASPVAKSPRASAASPGSRLGAACQPYKVLFTGLVDEAGEKVVVRLGGSLALGVSDMTHLVTDKVRRTVKFLCAMARGIPVVTTQWLEKSAKAGSFLSPSAFIVKDMEQEKKFNFCLQESISIASNQPLLQGYKIHVTKSVKPEPTHMLDIISCCGASFLGKMPSSHKEQTVVVSCEEDWPLCGPAVAAALPVVSAEFLLTGILQQKADVEAYALPSAPATTTPPQPAGARGRGRRRT